jgi:hypothetical protein
MIGHWERVFLKKKMLYVLTILNDNVDCTVVHTANL